MNLLLQGDHLSVNGLTKGDMMKKLSSLSCGSHPLISIVSWEQPILEICPYQNYYISSYHHGKTSNEIKRRNLCVSWNIESFFPFFLLLLLIPSLLIVTYNIAKYIPLRVPPIFHLDFIHRKYYTDHFKINSMKFNFELNFLKCFDLFSNGKNLTRERHAVL